MSTFILEGWRFKIYSLSPSRYSLLVISTSSQSISKMRLVLSNVRVTSQKDIFLRFSVPENMTSIICVPRICFADCSPSTQRMASATLLLPQPLGPTMQVTPSERVISVGSAKDLNPTSFIDLN